MQKMMMEIRMTKTDQMASTWAANEELGSCLWSYQVDGQVRSCQWSGHVNGQVRYMMGQFSFMAWSGPW